jgi:hypothetical protein
VLIRFAPPRSALVTPHADLRALPGNPWRRGEAVGGPDLPRSGERERVRTGEFSQHLDRFAVVDWGELF